MWIRVVGWFSSHLHEAGSLASVLGLLIGLVSLFLVFVSYLKISSLRDKLRDVDHRRRIKSWFMDIASIPRHKEHLTDDQHESLRLILSHVKTYYVSWCPFCDRKIRKLLRDLHKLQECNARARLIRENVAVLESQVLTMHERD